MLHLYRRYPKEYWKLRWEYLRRSDKYKEICLKFGTPEQISDHELKYSFAINGDVHRPPMNDFEQWYQFKQRQIQERGYWDKEVQIKYLKDFMQEKLQEVANLLSEKLEREPTISEVQDHLFGSWGKPGVTHTDAEVMSFVVTPGAGHTSKEITNKVRQWYKGRAVRRPSINYEALKTYLRVYDLRRQGRTIQQIVEDEDLAGDRHTNERIYQRYYKKAKRIIRYTELNFFPGL